MTDEVGNTTAEQVNAELAALSREEVLRIIASMEDDMASASQSMDYEEAARLRDQVVKLRAQRGGRKRGRRAEGLEEGRPQGQRLRQPQERRLRIEPPVVAAGRARCGRPSR